MDDREEEISEDCYTKKIGRVDQGMDAELVSREAFIQDNVIRSLVLTLKFKRCYKIVVHNYMTNTPAEHPYLH